MFSTRRDLKNACLEILSLAAHLNAPNDRMAVYCMAEPEGSINSKLSDACELYPLQPLDIRILARQLKRVPKQQSFSAPNLRGALLRATNALNTFNGISSPKIHVSRDIVVLSPISIDIAACTRGIDPSIQIHLFNPGTVPYIGASRAESHSTSYFPSAESVGQDSETLESPQHASNSCRSIGWVLDSAQCISGHCHQHGSHSLGDVVTHCRAQPRSGCITNISISFESRPNGLIENILGCLEYPVLFPGQVISVMVQVRLKTLKPLLSWRDPPAPLFEHSSGYSMSEAISDIEMTLGEHLSELFDVQVRYDHSLFPDNTQLLAHETCWLRRTLSPRQSRSENVLVRKRPQFRSSVQKQLALCLASLESPEDALDSLEFMSTSKRATASCLRLIEALKITLRHRIQFLANGSNSSQPSPGQRSGSWSPTPLSPGCRLSLLETNTQDRINELEETLRPSSESPATVIRRRMAATPDVEASNETARKIWQHIRKTSRPERELLYEQTGNTELQEHTVRHIEEIKKAVMKNQRKISAETLISLARDIRHVSRGVSDVDGVDE
jgi:hypothetical protein